MENEMEIWFVGTAMDDGRWMPEGAFITESEAADAAKDSEFILLANVGERFPSRAEDAKKIYWPKQETWEQSTLYRTRHNAKVTGDAPHNERNESDEH